MTRDAVVIGGGPAGLAAATWLARLPADGARAGQWGGPQPLGGGLPRLPRPGPGGPAEVLARARAEPAVEASSCGRRRPWSPPPVTGLAEAAISPTTARLSLGGGKSSVALTVQATPSAART